MKFTSSRFLTPALAATLALGLAAAPGAEAAKKKKDDDHRGKKDRKEASHREAPRGNPRTTHASSPRTTHAVTRREAPTPSRSSASTRSHAVAGKRTQAPSRVASHRPDRDRDKPAARHPVQRPSVNREAIASRERSLAGRTHGRAAGNDSPRSRPSVHRDPVRRDHVTTQRRDHRDRSHYRQRHEHHDHGWYRDNGWRYDADYYRTYRRHRYYNDVLATFIFDTSGPVYDYSASTPVYDGYGYDLETLYAVQAELANAGYYRGAIDGQIGPGSRAAIINYQQDYNLPVTGRVDSYLLESLGIQ